MNIEIHEEDLDDYEENDLMLTKGDIARFLYEHRDTTGDVSADSILNEKEQLPFNIDALQIITEIDIQPGESIKYIPNSVCNLKKLKMFRLNSSSYIYELPCSFGNLENLVHLDLEDNNIILLNNSIGKLKNLECLQLEGNLLESIPDSIGNLSSLTYLDLGINNLTKIPDTIGDLINLTYLNLRGNGLSSIPDTIGNLVNLTELNLAENNLSCLPDTIGNLKNLKTLILYDNNLKQLPESFAKLRQLEELEIFSNKMTCLPTTFGNLTNLRSIEIDNNCLTELPTSFVLLNSLRRLCMSCNHFKNIPEEIPEYIQYLSMSSNMISNINIDWMSYKNLALLSLANNFVHTIPREMSNLSKLKTLNLQNNNIRRIPDELAQCDLLSIINIRGNPIEYIPNSLNHIVEVDINQELLQTNVYNDHESVHNSHIQQSIKRSIQNLMKDTQNTSLPNIINQINHDDILTSQVKQLIIDYSQDNTQLENLGNLKYSDLLRAVWQRVQKHKESDEIKKILVQEITDGIGKCFSGKLAQLVNCLVGYYDDIEINISQNEQINIIILHIKKKLLEDNGNLDYNLWKNKVETELTSRGYNPGIIGVYLKAIEDMA